MPPCRPCQPGQPGSPWPPPPPQAHLFVFVGTHVGAGQLGFVKCNDLAPENDPIQTDVSVLREGACSKVHLHVQGWMGGVTPSAPRQVHLITVSGTQTQGSLTDLPPLLHGYPGQRWWHLIPRHPGLLSGRPGLCSLTAAPRSSPAGLHSGRGLGELVWTARPGVRWRRSRAHAGARPAQASRSSACVYARACNEQAKEAGEINLVRHFLSHWLA